MPGEDDSSTTSESPVVLATTLDALRVFKAVYLECQTAPAHLLEGSFSCEERAKQQFAEQSIPRRMGAKKKETAHFSSCSACSKPAFSNTSGVRLFGKGLKDVARLCAVSDKTTVASIYRPFVSLT